MHKRFSREGFTLVEISLSIAFIAILSIAVALIVTNAISSYHRGVVLNQINTTGMDIVDDMRGAIQNAQARSLVNDCVSVYYTSDSTASECEQGGAQNFVSVVRTAEVKRGGRSIGSNIPVFGAFCTGSYSYIWNSGYFFNTSEYTVNDGRLAKATLRYRAMNSGGTRAETKDRSDFKLLKVKDEDRSVCIAASGSGYTIPSTGINGGSNRFDISADTYNVIEEEPLDVLSGDNSLALYNLTARSSAESAALNNMLYSVSFIMGTIQGGVNIDTTGDYCVTPGDYNNATIEGFDYCAINKFNFAAQANGG